MLFVSKKEILKTINQIIETEAKDHTAYDTFIDEPTDDDKWRQIEISGSEHKLYDGHFTITDEGIELNTNEDDIHFHFIEVFNMSNFVSHIYDEDYDIDYWEELNLGGDGDVDYNGSYIDIIY